jgi:hypothetical protein
MNLIPSLRWRVDEWFPNPKIHGILQNVIQVAYMAPTTPMPLVEGQNHRRKKIHATTS